MDAIPTLSEEPGSGSKVHTYAAVRAAERRGSKTDLMEPDMTRPKPSEDPAEGSRKVIERELERGEKPDPKKAKPADEREPERRNERDR